MRVKIGDKIKILGLAPDSNGSPDPAAADYVGREGVVEYIDDAGQVHGTWGGVSLLPWCDEFEILEAK